MASSIINYPAIIIPSRKCRMIRQKPSQVRAQSHKDEGRSWHVADAHLQVLMERIERERIKERLEKSLTCKQGWNYSTTATSECYDHKKQKKKLYHASQTLGFTILGCTFCLYLTSILIHLNF